MLGDASLIPAAMWDVTIDVATLTASVGKRPDERSGQTYAETYLMEVTRYFSPSVMEIEGVTRTAPDRIKVDYTIAHPFAAATDPDAPASATNRADLGITGIVMFPLDVTDETPITYFADTARPIIANTDAIATADGYYVPAGLVYQLNMQANCFPFRRLVNDARRESRIGVPLVNLGVGNFDPDFGWQRSNWGPTQTGWTGYGALHQGQVARNSVELNLPADPVTSISLPVMLIAKYLDPVGPGSSPADRSANRLPTADADRTKFLYRMPQAAWDLERVEVQVGGNFEGAEVSNIMLRMRITDWDYASLSMSSGDLAKNLQADRVPQSEIGPPHFSIDMPTLKGLTLSPEHITYGFNALEDDDRAVGGDAAVDSGHADDPFYYPCNLQRSGAKVYPSGEHKGLVRMFDSSALPGQDIHPISPWLGPVVVNAPMPETYQAFQVKVDGPSLTGACRLVPSAEIESGQFIGVEAAIISSFLWANPWLEIDWNGDGDLKDPNESNQYSLSSDSDIIAWPEPVNNPTTEPWVRTIIVRVHFQDQVETMALEYTVGPNHPPEVDSKYDYRLNAQRLPSPATFQLESLDAVDEENDLLTYAVATLHVPGLAESSILPLTLPGAPLSYPTHQFTRYSIYVTDAAHLGTSGTFVRSQVLRVDGVPPAGWALPVSRNGIKRQTHALTYDAQGHLYLAIGLDSDWSIGDETFPGDTLMVLSLDASGALRWANPYRLPNTAFNAIGQVAGIVMANDGQLLLAVDRAMSFDFGGGSRSGEGLTLLKLDSHDGSYVWDKSWFGDGLEFSPELLLRPDESMVLAGFLTGSGEVNFSGTPRTVGELPMAFVLQLSAMGDFQWEYASLGGSAIINQASLDQTGICYLAGEHSGAVDYGAGLEITSEPSGLLLAVSPTGGLRWVKIFEDPAGRYSAVMSVAGSTIGDGCFAAGWGAGEVYLAGAVATEISNGFWVRYNSDGVWQEQRVEVGNGFAIQSLSDGGWVIGGNYGETIDLGSGPIEIEEWNTDRYLVRLDATLAPVWQTLWQNGSSDSISKVAVSPTGPIAISALARNVTDHDPGPAEFFSRWDEEAIITVSGETGQW